MCEFKVGDKVRVRKSSIDFEPRLWDKYSEVKYSIVEAVYGDRITTSEDPHPAHYSHFEHYEEETKHIPQQPTKRIDPSCVEDWHKAVGMYYKGGKVEEFKWVASGEEVGVCFINEFGSVLVKGGFDKDIELEIPVTAKRIPFDPERKDAKVFYGEQKLLEWVQMKSGVVCGVIKAGPFDGEHTSLYYPNDLKMEIEE